MRLSIDNRPQPKPHFAAIQPPPPKLAPAVLQHTAIMGVGGHSRPSLVPNPNMRPGSRVPRVSAYGAGGAGYQPFALGGGGGGKRMSYAGAGGVVEEKSSLTMGLTDKEIDERVGFLFSDFYCGWD